MSKLLADNVWFKVGDAYYKLSEWIGGMVPLGTAAGKFLYTTAAKVWAEADITAFGRSLVAASGTTVDLIIEIDGGGTTITTGVKGYIPVDFDFTITQWTLVADQSGSIVIDCWKDTYANFPPTVADTIAGSEKPTLSTAQKNQDTALTTWTTAVAAGSVLGINVDSVTTCTRVALVLKGTKTSV